MDGAGLIAEDGRVASSHWKPCLRPVETIVVPDEKHGRVLVLRDTQGVATGHAVLPPPLVPIVARMTGAFTCAEIARAASAELGREVPVDAVVALAEALDRGLFLEGDTFERALSALREDFARALVRPASHAGGAYHDDPDALRRYIAEACLAKAPATPAPGPLRALVAPHIDPWRGAVGYGHAYRALAAALPAEADTFVLLGTSHAPMRSPFSLCRKAFDTPLGRLEVDGARVDALAAAARFDPYADQLNHLREHSLEFQAVFLKHALGDREARIVPILCGLGEEQARGTQPRKKAAIARFLDALRELWARAPGRVVLVAGADLAHVGPRFGDRRGLDEEGRRALERTDRASLALATAGETEAFWEHVVADLDERRVCGLGPMVTLLDALGAAPGTTGTLLHYEQNVDASDGGSVVSYAALAFHG